MSDVGTGARAGWRRTRTGAAGLVLGVLGWWIMVSQACVLVLWKASGGLPSRAAPNSVDFWQRQDVPLDGYNPILAVAGLVVLVVGVAVVLAAFAPADGDQLSPAVARSVYASRLNWLPLLAFGAAVAATLLNYGAGLAWQYQAFTETRVIGLTPWGYAFIGAIGLAALVSMRLLLSRATSEARHDVDWCRWANTLGSVPGRIALEHRQRQEHPGTTLPLGSASVRDWSVPGTVSSTHSLHHGYSLVTGHPMGIPLAPGIMAAKAVVNGRIKRAYVGPTAEDLRRDMIADTRERLVEVLDELESRVGDKLSRRDAARRERDLRRTHHLLRAVIEA